MGGEEKGRRDVKRERRIERSRGEEKMKVLCSGKGERG